MQNLQRALLLQNCDNLWEQAEETTRRLAADVTHLTSFPQPYSASASFATAHTPWYLDYGHLTFWFFFFATGVIILWLVYLFVGLTKNVEARRVIRETRGYSRAQTGDTMTAVLPLTWSVTMLAHASTHSANFDENTAATVFSFTVIAYQWGWNYYFPREIAELLAGAPRIAGRGHVIAGQPQDTYALLLAQVRREYLASLLAGGRYTARHGRYSAASVLHLMLPTTTEGAPAWALGGVSLAVTPRTLGDAAVLIGQKAPAQLNAEVYLASAQRRQGKSRLLRELTLPTQGGISVLSTKLQASRIWASPLLPTAPAAYALSLVAGERRPLTPVSQPTRPAVSAAWVGNRLAQIHTHLATGAVVATEQGRINQASAALYRFLESDRVSAYHASPVWALLGVGQAPTLANLALPTARQSVAPGAAAWAAIFAAETSQGGPRGVLRWALLGAVNAERSGAPLAGASTEAALLQSAVRANSALSQLGGAEAALTSADRAPNSAGAAQNAAAIETPAPVLGQVATAYAASSSALQPQRALAPREWVGVGLQLSASAGLQIAPEAGQLQASTPPSITPSPRFPLPSPLAAFTLSCPVEGFITPATGVLGGVRAPRIVLGLLGDVARAKPEAGFTPLPLPVSPSCWLEGAPETQPTRAAAAVGGDVAQVNARGDAAGLVALVATQDPLNAWRSLWAWQTATASLPWDRNFRAAFARRPGVGLGQPWAPTSMSTAAAVLDLQRQRFDKNLATLLQPRAERLRAAALGVETGRAVLDGERGALLPVWALVLPLPYLDVDPTFVHTRWSGEVNTSRRSDHDARFRVLWGPLAAAWTLQTPAARPRLTWAHVAGPGVAGSLAARVQRELSLLSQGGINTPSAYPTETAAALTTSMYGLQAAQAFAVGKRTSGGTSVRTATPAGQVRRLARTLAQPSLPSPLLQPATIDGGSLIWTYAERRPHLGGWGGMVGGAASHDYWLARLVGHLEVFAAEVQLQAARLGQAPLAAALTPAAQHPLIGLLLRAPALTGKTVAPEHGTPLPEGAPTLPRGGYLAIDPSIGAQRRLRVTKGVYLPADVPMHGIFGSKDVIHSWAIPGLGIKIDCIPGYSSHRRLTLRWRGLYWGQCMEVCGRYHHWMPILVRVVHKDVFLLWCLAYLRLITLRSASGVVMPGVVAARTVWAAAAAQTAQLPAATLRVTLD